MDHKKNEFQRLLRLYRKRCSVLLYQVDQFCLAGFYLHGRMANHTPQLQVNTRSLLGQALQTEFETLWKSSRCIELQGMKSDA